MSSEQKCTKFESLQYRTHLKLNDLDRNEIGYFESLKSFPIQLDDGIIVDVELSFYPLGRFQTDSEYIELCIEITERSENIKNIKQFHLDYAFNLDLKYAKYAKKFMLQRKENGDGYFERYFNFMRIGKVGLLKKNFNFKVSIHSIRYSKRKRKKRASITNVSFTQITEKNDESENDDEIDIDYKELYKQEVEKNDKLNLENETLTSQNEKQKLKIERYRFAVISLKNLCEKFPSANLKKIEWAKPDKSSHGTVRSKAIHQIREWIQSQPEYQGNTFSIEPNPQRHNYQFEHSQSQLNDMKMFFEENVEGNAHPMIVRMDKRSDKIIKTRRIEQCEWQNELNGDMETFALCDIPKGVILGQYIGDEMLKEEYEKMFDFTMEEAVHSKYLHGESLFVPNDLLLNEPKRKKRKKNKKTKGKVIELYIDAFKRMNPLNMINDCRANISSEQVNEADAERANCEFVSVLVNGWPSILVRTTKKIKKNQSLLICYGADYGNVLEQMKAIKDMHNKFDAQIANILAIAGNDLGDSNRFELE